MRGLGLPVHHFRDPRIAASLKQAVSAEAVTANVAFPRSPDRGLIEAAISNSLRYSLLSRFPRSPDRGLIEATQPPRNGDALHIFPRSPDRGLIEAYPAVLAGVGKG